MRCHAEKIGGGEKRNWKYPSGDTKDFWKEGVCKTGFRQSPIKINTTLSPATIHAPLKYLSYFTNTNFNNKVPSNLRNYI